jgi:hypothetical protein
LWRRIHSDAKTSQLGINSLYAWRRRARIGLDLRRVPVSRTKLHDEQRRCRHDRHDRRREPVPGAAAPSWETIARIFMGSPANLPAITARSADFLLVIFVSGDKLIFWAPAELFLKVVRASSAGP